VIGHVAHGGTNAETADHLHLESDRAVGLGSENFLHDENHIGKESSEGCNIQIIQERLATR
jgi:hypothetical protein